LTFAGILAFWGVLWGPLRFLHPLWQGKGAFLRLPQSTCASGYKHHTCYVTKLQCQIWGMGTGKAREWKALTQGTQEKKTENFVAPCLLRVSARFFLSALPGIYTRQFKLEWGQTMACVKAAWFFLSVAPQFMCCTRDHSFSCPQTHIEYAGQYGMFDIWGLEWGQTMACVKSGVVFSECRTTISVLHLRPQLLLSPNSHRICRVMCLIFGDRQVVDWHTGCATGVKSSRCRFFRAPPASAPLPNLQAPAEKTEILLSSACLRSRIGGVGAEICLRKVK